MVKVWGLPLSLRISFGLIDFTQVCVHKIVMLTKHRFHQLIIDIRIKVRDS